MYNEKSPRTPRTDSEFENFHYKSHHNKISPLTKVSKCASGFPLDSMHMVYLGVVRRMLSFLRKKSKAKISMRQWKELSDLHENLNGCLPSEFNRQPRSFFEVDRWKATEFKFFLLITGVIILKKVFSKKLYEHFLLLSVAIRIFNMDQNSKALHNTAIQLLERFVRQAKTLYGSTFVVIMYIISCTYTKTSNILVSLFQK